MPRWSAWIVAFLIASPGSAQELVHVATGPRDGTIFGEIGDVDLTPDGHMVVLDTQADVVYLLDVDGRLVRQLGGEGQGPGEIMLSAEVEVGTDGRIVVSDAQNRRLTVWDAGGELVTSVRFDALFGSAPLWPHDLAWSEAGLFLKFSNFTPDSPLSVYRVPEEMEAAAELVLTIEPAEGATCTFCSTTVDPAGAVVAAAADTLYAVSRFGEDGAVVHRWERTGVAAVRRTDAELERLRSTRRGYAAVEGGDPNDGPGPDEFKTRFGPHALNFDGRGRLWAAPRVGEGENGRLDVFTAEGGFVRTLSLEVPLNGFRIRGDHLVVSSESPLGEPTAHVYRIEG